MHRGPVERAAARFVTGPVGHLVFGVADVVALVARELRRRLSR